MNPNFLIHLKKTRIMYRTLKKQGSYKVSGSEDQYELKNYHLTELQLIIRDSLYLSLPQMFWVAAEISEITVNSSGHCYLELVEKHPDEKNIRARIRGIIWNSRFSFIRSFFENINRRNSQEEGSKYW